MKNNIPILLYLVMFLLLPKLGVSDCTNFERVNSWYVQDEKTNIYYSQNNPVCKIVLHGCEEFQGNPFGVSVYPCDSST